MWRPPDKGCWGALGLGLFAAWFVLLCGWEPFLAILFAAAAHELGHYLALRLQGAAVTGLRLSPWGVVMDCRRDVLSYGGELLALLAGPLANLALSAALCLVPHPPETLIGAGLVLGGFNLLPLRRLDGGEALRCGLSYLLGPERGEAIAAAVKGKLSPPPLLQPPQRTTPCTTSSMGAAGSSAPHTAQPSTKG